MDIIDKHQAVVIVIHAGAFEYPAELQRRYMAHKGGIPCNPPFDLTEELKRYGKLIPQVAFSDFCWGESEPVAQALTGMHNYVIKIVEGFDKFLT